MDNLPPEVSSIVSPARDSLDSLNTLCRVIEPLNSEQREKLAAVVLMARAESVNEVRQLAEIWGPPASPAKGGSRGERGSSKMSELCRWRQSERYTALHALTMAKTCAPLRLQKFAHNCYKRIKLCAAATQRDLPSSRAASSSLRPSISPTSITPPHNTFPRFFHRRCSIRWS